MIFKKPNYINSVMFTSREIDVIACILNVRGVKKIGDILDISHRTVENYIKTILGKISSNSQEAIKDFVEKSSELILVKQHYIDLLINKLFTVQIAKVAEKLKGKNITCIIRQTEDPSLRYIISCLKLANIEVIEKPNKNVIDESNQKIIKTLTEKNLSQLKQEKDIDGIIFICLDKKWSDDSLQELPSIEIIECFEKDQIYSSMLDLSFTR